MARVTAIGFEAGTISSTGEISEDGSAISNTASIQSTIKRTGTYAFRANPTTTGTGFCDIRRQAVADWTSLTGLSLATVYFRFYLYVATSPPSYEICAGSTDSGVVTKVDLRIQTSGSGFVFRIVDAGGTTYDNATVFPLSTWLRVDFVIGTSASAATIELYVNGTNYIKTTTGNTGANNNDRCRLGKFTNINGNTVDFYYDDVVIDDSGLVGESSIVMLYPNAAGTDQAWTASAGTHWETVDDWNTRNGDDGDTTYNSVSASGTQSEEEDCLAFTGNFPDALTFPAVVAVLVQRNVAAQANVGTPRLRSGTTNSDGIAYDPGTAQKQRFKLFTTDPNTGAAWTKSAIDALQVGFVKTQAQAREMRMTACAVMVEYTPNLQEWLDRKATERSLYTRNISY